MVQNAWEKMTKSKWERDREEDREGGEGVKEKGRGSENKAGCIKKWYKEHEQLRVLSLVHI